MQRRMKARRGVQHGPTRGGFTLVELLVVITILSMLMALLLPSLRQARSAARKAACISNLRQIGVALLSYCDDQDDGAFPSQGRWQASWMVRISPYLGWTGSSDFSNTNEMATTDGQLHTFTTQNNRVDHKVKAFICPESYRSGKGWLYYSGYYGMNLILTNGRPDLNPTNPTAIALWAKRRTLRTAKHTSKLILVGDCNIFAPDQMRDYTESLWKLAGSAPSNARLRAHDWSLNFLFVDGHVANHRGPNVGEAEGQRMDLMYDEGRNDQPSTPTYGWKNNGAPWGS